MAKQFRGYDMPALFREDTLERIKRLRSEINMSAIRMNNIIKKGHLPEELVEEPFPEDDECE